jgi:hypothetical protein
MSDTVQWVLVGVVIALAAILFLRKLLPNALKIRWAHQLQGRLPDRLRIWLVKDQGCGQCSPSSIKMK